VAGVVTAVGSDVDCFKVGDAVYGDSVPVSMGNHPGGSVADAVLVEADLLANEISTRILFSTAATLLVVIVIALDGFTAVRLAPGNSVLITGGAVGVGRMAIQPAKRDAFTAATVATTASAPEVASVKSLGTDVVVADHASAPAAELFDNGAPVDGVSGDVAAVLPALAPSAAGRAAAVATVEASDAWTSVPCVPSGVDPDRRAGVLEGGLVVPIVTEFAFDAAGVEAAAAEMGGGRVVRKMVLFMSEVRPYGLSWGWESEDVGSTSLFARWLPKGDPGRIVL